MKILALNYEYPPLGGGGASVCQQLCEHYASRGHGVDVVTMAHAGLPRREEIRGVVVRRVPSLRRRPDICETHEMASYVAVALPVVAALLRRGRYDVVHTHFVLPTGLLAYAATRFSDVPFVVTAHGSDIPGFNPDRFRFEHRFTGPTLRLVMRNAACLTSPSRFLRDLIVAACGSYAVEIVPNGIDVSRMRPAHKKRRVLMTGRLLPRKGFHHVLDALRGIEGDFDVHIAGDGPMRTELEVRARGLEVPVVFHGWLDNRSDLLKDLYEESSIFCLPSTSENAPVSLLEAMLSGMAVVTSNTTGCAETIGDAGLVVPTGDTRALQTVLRRLLASDGMCSELGQRARKRVEECFDWRAIGDRYLTLLASAARAPEEV